MPQPKTRPDSPVPSLQGPCDWSLKSWKRKQITDYTIKDIRVQIYEAGKRVYECPSVKEVQQYCKDQLETIWEETLRFENPQTYYVDLSKPLWNLKHDLLNKYSSSNL